MTETSRRDRRFLRLAGSAFVPMGILYVLLAAAILLTAWAPGAAAQEGDYSPEAPPAALEVPLEQFFVVGGGLGTVRVMQRTVVYNAGVVPYEGVLVSVPAGVRLLEPPEGWGTMEPAADGLQDGRPLAPGESREYRILYEAVLGSRPMAFTRALPYPVREMTFWVEARVAALTGLQLTEIGEETLSDARFRVYGMGPVGPHPAWQVVVRPSGASGPGRALPDLSAGARRHGDPLAWWTERLSRWPWLVPLAAVSFGAAVWWRRRPAPVKTTARERRLKAEIVRLDVAYGVGEVDDEAYAARRRQLLDQLIALKRETGFHGGSEADGRGESV